jgi:hypothetical protein
MMKKGGSDAAKGADADAGAEGSSGKPDNRFAALFEREEFQRDATSEEFKLRNPSNGLNRNKKSRGGDSEDEMEDLFQPVEDDGDDGRYNSDDDYDIDDEELDSYGGGSGGDDDDEDSDIEAIRADEGNSRKRKKQRKQHDDSDEEGQIAKASRLAMERLKAKTKAQAKAEKATSGSSSAGKTGKSASKGVRMYEIAEGVSSSKAVFGHTDEYRSQRKAERMIGEIPLMDRVKSSSRGRTNANDDEADGDDDDHDDGDYSSGGGGRKTKSGSRIRSVKTAKDGIVKELSFMPKQGKVKASQRLSKD